MPLPLDVDIERIAMAMFGSALCVLALSGCATGTRTGHLGPVSASEHLVTLVVTEDTAVVRRECPLGIVATRHVLGCQTSRPVEVDGSGLARAVKIVRFTDSLPSAMAFEIDIHELCHAVAALQPIPDPCHVGNGGVVQHYPSALPRTILVR